MVKSHIGRINLCNPVNEWISFSDYVQAQDPIANIIVEILNDKREFSLPEQRVGMTSLKFSDSYPSLFV